MHLHDEAWQHNEGLHCCALEPSWTIFKRNQTGTRDKRSLPHTYQSCMHRWQKTLIFFDRARVVPWNAVLLSAIWLITLQENFEQENNFRLLPQATRSTTLLFTKADVIHLTRNPPRPNIDVAKLHFPILRYSTDSARPCLWRAATLPLPWAMVPAWGNPVWNSVIEVVLTRECLWLKWGRMWAGASH